MPLLRKWRTSTAWSLQPGIYSSISSSRVAPVQLPQQETLFQTSCSPTRPSACNYSSSLLATWSAVVIATRNSHGKRSPDRWHKYWPVWLLTSPAEVGRLGGWSPPLSQLQQIRRLMTSAGTKHQLQTLELRSPSWGECSCSEHDELSSGIEIFSF